MSALAYSFRKSPRGRQAKRPHPTDLSLSTAHIPPSPREKCFIKNLYPGRDRKRGRCMESSGSVTVPQWRTFTTMAK